jgi:hypothetical protein
MTTLREIEMVGMIRRLIDWVTSPLTSTYIKQLEKHIEKCREAVFRNSFSKKKQPRNNFDMEFDK